MAEEHKWTDANRKEFKAFVNFVLDNLQPSSILHKETSTILKDMWEQHKVTEQKLDEIK
jgi:hypothetical protein